MNLLYAIGNGRYRTKAEAGKLKAEGLKAGMPDLCLPVANRYRGENALFLEMKSTSVIRERAALVARRMWLPVTVLILLFVGYSLADTDLFDDAGVGQIVALVGAVIALVATGRMIYRDRQGWAFVGTGLAIVLVVVVIFAGLYPRVMPSSTDSAFDLTVYNASSSDYTLEIMTVVALIFVPVVLLYQAWTYWVFRKRVQLEDELEY